MSILRPDARRAGGAPAPRPRLNSVWKRCTAMLLLAGVTTLAPACASGGRPPIPEWAEPRVGVPNPLAGMEDYHFNGATHQVSPPGSFHQDDVIRVVVTDANPFLFDYKILYNEQRVVEASISQFFNFAFGITFPAAKAERQSEDAELSPTVKFVASMLRLCSDEQENAATALRTRLEDAQERRRDIVAAFDRIQAVSHATDAAFAEATKAFTRPTAQADTVKAAAIRGMGEMKRFVDTVGALHGSLTSEVRGWAVIVADLNDDARELGGSCATATNVVEDVAKLVPDTATFRANLETVDKKVKEARAEYERIRLIASDDGRYYRTGLLPRFDAPSDVTITIQRRPAGTDANWHDVAVQRINVGGRARFSLSAGLGWTELGTTSYGVTTRFVTPQPGGADSIHTIVALDRSGEQIFPMVTFNTLLTPSRWRLPLNPHLVLGIGVSRKDRTPLPGYLVGLGTDALSRRLLVTGGVFFGEEHRLGGGLRVGDRVPESIAESIPVERRLVGKLGIGISYRIF